MKVILLVDDELLLLKALAFDFQRRGFEAVTASNGAEAWEKLQVKTVDLIISDLNMPELDGKGLLVKTKALFPHMPFILFMTGSAILNEEEAKQLGCSEVLSKPFEREHLFKTVERLLAGS